MMVMAKNVHDEQTFGREEGGVELTEMQIFKAMCLKN